LVRQAYLPVTQSEFICKGSNRDYGHVFSILFATLNRSVVGGQHQIPNKAVVAPPMYALEEKSNQSQKTLRVGSVTTEQMLDSGLRL